MDAVLDSTHSATGYVAVRPASFPPLGFSLLEVAGRSYTHRYLGLDTLSISASLPSQNGIFHLTCVRADWEQRGVGSAFYARRLRALSEQNVPRAVGLAWCRPHTLDSRVLFRKFDFTCLAVVEGFYRRTGGRPHCPDCDGSCSCAAALYTRPVN